MIRKVYTIILTVFWVFMTLACSTPSNDSFIIDISSVKPEKVSSSDIFKEVETIILKVPENRAIVEISTFKVYPSGIYIKFEDYETVFAHWDFQGNLLNWWDGDDFPENYLLHLADFYVDENADIHLSLGNRKKILSIKGDGSGMEEKLLPYPSFVFTKHQDIWHFYYGVYDSDMVEKYNFAYSKDLDTFKFLMPIPKDKKGIIFIDEKNFNVANNQLVFWQYANDTIFHWQDQEWLPRNLLDFGKSALAKNEINRRIGLEEPFELMKLLNSEDVIYGPTSFQESDAHLFVGYKHKAENRTFWWDKKTGQKRNLQKIINTHNGIPMYNAMSFS